MRSFLCFFVLVLFSVVSFAQNRFYADDIVQAKIDSARYMSAISYIEGIEKVDIDTAWSLFPKKAFCYYKIGKHKEARLCLEIAEREDYSSQLSEILTVFYMIDSPKNMEDAIERLVELYDEGEKKFFYRIAILGKRDLKKIANFIDGYVAFLDEDEDKTLYNLMAAYFYFQAKEYINAYNKFASFIDKEPTAWSSYVMGLIKCEQSEYLSAVSYFYQAEDLGEKSGDLYMNRAKAKGYERDFFGAIEDLNLALEKNAKAEYYFLRGVCFNEVLEYKYALDDLNIAIDMCDTVADYFNYRGIVFTNLGKHADALFEFQTAIKMNPNAEFINNNIGLAYEHNGLVDKAIEHYLISIKKEPYHSDSFYNLGRLNYERRNYKKAIKYLKEAYLLNANFGDITHYLGLCYLKLEDKEKACYYFQISIDAGCKAAINSQTEYCSEEAVEREDE
jgi:tetratricopeptide (TPR) repeat protein